MTQHNTSDFVPWKRYIFAVAEAAGVFTLASFLLGLYIIREGTNSIPLLLFFILIYAAAVITSIYRMARKFSLAANMLMIPIAPLVILIIVVSLIHLLQFFK
ncbi:MAG TPA: hypothetical protein VL360_06540 [Gammaproteobacteria bacterium]|nr:hypothetical protein [Gammaproteobacteria bacterium]